MRQNCDWYVLSIPLVHTVYLIVTVTRHTVHEHALQYSVMFLMVYKDISDPSIKNDK